jgi:citrate synthase
MTEISAAEAAARLGVKRETLYAYVSRGVLGRRRRARGRGSVFDADEVDALAARVRRGGRAGALEVVVASALTSLEGDRLRYRGRDAVELARSATFEAVAEFLWTGQAGVLATRPRWPDAPGFAEGVGAPGTELDALARFRIAVALASSADELRYDLEPSAVAAAGRRAVAAMVGALPTRRDPAARSVAARLWAGLTSLRPTPAHVALMDDVLVLLADHELAVSTLAARVAASARADPYSVVSTGLGVLAGSLHGGAGRLVRELLDEVGEPGRAARVVGERLRRGERLPGLGHKVYRERDPRADALVPKLYELRLLPGRRDVIQAVLAILEDRVDAPLNVDFALGALAYGTAMGLDATEAMFAVARTAGWLAHAIEEYTEEPLRFRAQAAYTGPISER